MSRKWRVIPVVAVALLVASWLFYHSARYEKYVLWSYCTRCGLIHIVNRHVVVWRCSDDRERFLSNSIHRWREARLGPCKEHHWCEPGGGGQAGTLAQGDLFDLRGGAGRYALPGQPGRYLDMSFALAQPKLPDEWCDEYAEFLLLNIDKDPRYDGETLRIHGSWLPFLPEDIGQFMHWRPTLAVARWVMEGVVGKVLENAWNMSEAQFRAWWVAEARPVILEMLGRPGSRPAPDTDATPFVVPISIL